MALSLSLLPFHHSSPSSSITCVAAPQRSDVRSVHRPAFPATSFGACKAKRSRFHMTLVLPSQPKEVKNNIRNQLSPYEIKSQVTHSMPQEKLEIFKSLDGWAEDNLLAFLKPAEKSWQPQDFLPESTSEDFFDWIGELRERAMEIPDEYYVCLVGNMVTEEALPTYQTFLNTLDGVRDETGACPRPWAVWGRSWTAEENRHGDLLNRYLYLCGRVDMRHIEKTIQYLIGSGMLWKTENNPYLGFVYTSFQERVTFITHGNTARHAKEYGDMALAKICGTIAADEKRHESAYTMIVEKLFEVDADTAMSAFADMMRKRITMPALLMFDGEDRNLFRHFSSVTQKIGLYTAGDYADIVEYFVRRWSVEKTTGLSSEGRRAQDYLCGLAPRIRKVEERAREKALEASLVPFSWIHNRHVLI